MIHFDVWAEVHVRRRRGEAISKIARDLSLDRKTVRRVVQQTRRAAYQRRHPSPTLLAPYQEQLGPRAAAVDYNAQRVFLELREQGFRGSYETVKRAVRGLRAERERLLEATMRFETAPGHQGQIDWGRVTASVQRQPQRVQMFAMVLGYSRCQYLAFTDDQRVRTLLRCHEDAFDWFGGVPEEMLYDNPKTIVLSRDVAGREIRWNPVFWDFAQYYGFRPRLCQPYRAQTKGKVEAGIKYGKRGFVLGRDFASVPDMNVQVREWIRSVADQRVHGTTFELPVARFRDERLRAHAGQPRYPFPEELLVRRVATDCLVTVETNRYSVPPAYVGRTVTVQWGPEGTVQLWHAETLIAPVQRQLDLRVGDN